jgi:hypothetical protein
MRTAPHAHQSLPPSLVLLNLALSPDAADAGVAASGHDAASQLRDALAAGGALNAPLEARHASTTTDSGGSINEMRLAEAERDAVQLCRKAAGLVERHPYAQVLIVIDLPGAKTISDG